MKVNSIVIGAGPSGLAIAGVLRKAGLNFEVLEQTDKIASKWHEHYDRLHLHTVKWLSSLPYQDFPDHYPKFVHKKQLIEYYQNYAQAFSIHPHFNTTVTSVIKKEEHWSIECDNAKIFEAKNVIIATGLNKVPKIPTWRDQVKFKGEIIHASSYKNPSRFSNKKVLIVGMGNTGAEIALDLAEASIDVSISIRSDVVLVPRDFLGRPVQLTAKTIAKLPFGLGDWISKIVRKIAFGDLEKYGIPVSKIPPLQLRLKYGKTPTIDIGTVGKIKEGKIKILKDIQNFEEKGVCFVDNHIENFDAIILATGYHARLDSLLGKDTKVLDQNGEPIVKIGANEADGLYFIGYEKFSFDGTLGTLKEEAELIINDIKMKTKPSKSYKH